MFISQIFRETKFEMKCDCLGTRSVDFPKFKLESIGYELISRKFAILHTMVTQNNKTEFSNK